MAMFSIDPFVISLLATISTVFGCGTIPAGQAKTVNFTVTGFTLPVAMVYSEKPEVLAKHPGIAPSRKGAWTFVKRLVKQTVFDALRNQGRSALLPDAVIRAILGQMTVRIRYQPMSCDRSRKTCFVVANTVTALCEINRGQCMEGTIVEVNPKHLSISGTLSTTNIIMANWSKAMWQNVVNRAIRMLATDPFGTHFYSAFATIDDIST
ncbi:hypothetical protein KIN20_015834 [Parelaphostrongylus tenuis]|uniref:Uncharacterized protein n=1 Tax=Parelaphostrongylus tenuis TaxID=148309 RepID=A0AAD5N1B0_PARTN|nr:hypothetical protein KIN20_015834 [Parelaphostrongylus tenuis]